MPLNTNSTIFTLDKFEKEIIIISIYVNDFFFAFNSPKVLLQLKNVILNKYNVKNFVKNQDNYQIAKN